MNKPDVDAASQGGLVIDSRVSGPRLSDSCCVAFPEREQGWEVAPPDWLVLRTGTLDTESTLSNYDEVFRAYGIHGMCVTAGPGPVDQLAHSIRALSKSYMHATVAEIRGGWTVIREPGRQWPAALLARRDEITGKSLDDIRPVFYARGWLDNPNSPIRRTI